MSAEVPPSLHLAVALDGTGWHPASWREPDARPLDLLTPRYWVDLVAQAERGHLDFVTIEDAFTLQNDLPSSAGVAADGVSGRLDAVLIASRVAPLTHRIGLMPTAVVTHTEPFHLSKAIATLDYVSKGRAGVRVQVSASPEAAHHVGRRDITQVAPSDLITEAADYVEVLRRLWDSWEDDAEIRDVTTGRFIDRKKVHYIDFEGATFSVRGPSITPRPPQGQPIVAALSHGEATHGLVAGSADIGFITPHDAVEVTTTVDALSSLAIAEGRSVRVFADLAVILDASADRASARRERLDERLGAPFTTDAGVFVGSTAALADCIEEWHAAGAAGFRLRPATLPHDLGQIVDGLVPELRRRGLFRGGEGATTLRGILGLPRPVSRYASA
ncbi:LLM class flavin-dependent oxidoreductase [Mycolicibacterium rufum]|uniref:LLM class flavin-dependent oxidoreductase n=2 Tax=Mycolicibacterium rufum TaxID=318424 RepID=A0ABY3U686_9MYCO|nr:LLM class flavin-dependent oxidoreductase [Mycolicibacterium rufum]ULP35122.1 LLM class flavin-dependent oxidoreductase [Mycolicibacterium rufum]